MVLKRGGRGGSAEFRGVTLRSSAFPQRPPRFKKN